MILSRLSRQVIQYNEQEIRTDPLSFLLRVLLLGFLGVIGSRSRPSVSHRKSREGNRSIEGTWSSKMITPVICRTLHLKLTSSPPHLSHRRHDSPRTPLCGTWLHPYEPYRH